MTKVVLKTVTPPLPPAPRAALALSRPVAHHTLHSHPAAHRRQFNTRGKAWGRLVWKGAPYAARDGDVTGSGRIRCSRKREWQWMAGSQLQRNAEAAEAAPPSSAAEATQASS